MPTQNDFSYMPATEMASLIRRRAISPVDVVTSLLDRIEARNPSLNAFVYLDRQGAIEAARSAEAKVASGDALGACTAYRSRSKICSISSPVGLPHLAASGRLPISGRQSIARSPSAPKRPAPLSLAKPIARHWAFAEPAITSCLDQRETRLI